MPGGRPSELTPDLAQEALKLARGGVPKRVIADIIGVGRSTFFYWLQIGSRDYKPSPTDKRKPPANLKPYQEFADAFVRARGEVIACLIATWLKAGYNGDAGQAAHWLKVNEPELFKDQADVNIEFGSLQGALDAWKDSILSMDKPKEQRQLEAGGDE